MESSLSLIRAPKVRGEGQGGEGEGEGKRGILGALWVMRQVTENALLSATLALDPINESLKEEGEGKGEGGLQGLVVDYKMALKHIDRLLLSPTLSRDEAMQWVAILERLKRSLSDRAAAVMSAIQPTCVGLGSRLGVNMEACVTLCEDQVRGGADAPLSQIIGAIEPRWVLFIRKIKPN